LHSGQRVGGKRLDVGVARERGTQPEPRKVTTGDSERTDKHAMHVIGLNDAEGREAGEARDARRKRRNCTRKAFKRSHAVPRGRRSGLSVTKKVCSQATRSLAARQRWRLRRELCRHGNLLSQLQASKACTRAVWSRRSAHTRAEKGVRTYTCIELQAKLELLHRCATSSEACGQRTRAAYT
jgi:hypothetical protein